MHRPQDNRKACKVTDEVRGWIERLMRQDLSPQQVVDYPACYRGIGLRHATVYQLIYQNKADGGNWYQHLRIARKPYRKPYGHYDWRGRITDRIGIERRPAVVGQRSRIGDREGGTMIG